MLAHFFFFILISTIVSQMDYVHCISVDYHKLVDGKTKDERIASLKEV